MDYILEIRCSKQTRKAWDALYLNVPEHPKVPHTGIPEWYYRHNYCYDCSSSLQFCRNNPYGFDSLYAYELRTRHVENHHDEPKPPTRAAAKKQKDEEDERLMPVLKEAYLKDATVTSLAKEFGIPASRVSQLLRASGVNIVRGRPIPDLIS